MKYTLLELVQSIMQAIESDEVNSINDTPDSQQVAQIVKETYFELVSELDLPEHFSFIELNATDLNTPTIMTLPENVLSLSWIKYDNQTSDDDSPVYKDVKFQEMDDFLTTMYTLSTSTDTIENFSITTDSATSVEIFAHNNAFPTKYTCFDDFTLVFDSYNSTYDTNLVQNKTLAYGLVAPSFELEDTFTPDLDSKQFALLLSEAKAQAFQEMQKRENPKAEKRARRGWIRTQRDKQAIPFPHSEWARLPNYGRKHR